MRLTRLSWCCVQAMAYFGLSLFVQDTAAQTAANHVVVIGDSFGFPKCVRQALARKHPRLTFVSSQDFRNELYPWFEPATAPKTVKELTLLMRRPAVRSAIERLGVRYAIAVVGHTGVDRQGGIACGTGPRAGGCLGAASWTENTKVSAVVWDFQAPARAQRAKASVSEKGFVVAFVLPIPLALTNTAPKACTLLAERLRPKLAGAIPQERPIGTTPGSAAPRCSDVGGYEAYMKRTGNACRLE